MSEQEFDLLLQDSLIQAALAEYRDELPVDQEAWTLPYRRDRELLRRDPKGWSKKKLRPLWRTVLQRAACFVLACLVGFSVVMATVPAARAAVLKWFRQVYETCVVYTFTQEHGEITIPNYKISALPEGYTETDRYEDDGYLEITYQNRVGENIVLIAVEMTSNSAFSLAPSSPDDGEVILINGLEGYYYESQVEGKTSSMIWADDSKNILFTLISYEPKDTMLQIAESVQLAENEEGLGELS
jgi:hypothetical protein